MNQITRINNYAVRAVKALMDGDSIKIDDDEYIYQDERILIKAIRIDGGVESEVWLGGMCSEVSLEYFLSHCAGKTLGDHIRDFPIKIPPLTRNAKSKYQEQMK